MMRENMEGGQSAASNMLMNATCTHMLDLQRRQITRLHTGRDTGSASDIKMMFHREEHYLGDYYVLQNESPALRLIICPV